jgi:GDP-mannose 6-dehydrogenase
LPKDLRAINYKAKELDVEVPLLSAILPSNRLQVERAIGMVLGSGKKRVGLLGLSFKAGTDDLRESPLVTLIETLLGKGLQIAIYDKDVSLARLVGANKEYIEREIPHISRLMKESAESVIEDSEIIVVGNKADEFLHVRKLLRDDQLLIDLVRLGDQTSDGNYEGICW